MVECEIARRLAGQLTAAQLGQLQALVDAEARADTLGDRSAAIRLSGEFHRALAQMCGNPVFLRLLEGLLPTTSLLMALYQPDGTPACVLHRHVELISALGRPGAVAAMAAAWAASTISYTSFCAGVKRPLTGKVRVMSAA